MRRAALLAAALLVPSAPVASIDFGPVQLGGAASHMLRVSALDATASGAGFSATRTQGGVLIVFEPYELGEQATGTLTLKTGSGLMRIRLLGHGIDTIPPSVAVQTPKAATAGRPLQIRCWMSRSGPASRSARSSSGSASLSLPRLHKHSQHSTAAP